MRRIFTLIALFSIISTQIKAQSGNEVSVSVTIPPPYSPYLSEYSDLLSQGIITITNLTGNPQTLKLIGYVQGDNGLEAFTNANYQPFNPIVLNPFETRVILAGQQNQEYLDANNISYNASQSIINQIQQTGILPEGNYQICIRALDFNNNQPLSPDAPMGCVFFPVIYVQPPFLTYPMCEDSVTVTNNMMVLNWLPVAAATPLPVVYDLYIVPLMAGQNPNDAMMGAINFGAGNPIIKLGLVTNSAITLPSDLPLQFGQWYAWAVVARDPSNTVVIENNGRSEVCTFYVKEQEPIAGTGIPPVYTPVNTGFNQQYQGLPLATITGQLDYRFHGDQYTGVNLSSLSSPVIQNITQNLFGSSSSSNSSTIDNSDPNSVTLGNTGGLNDAGWALFNGGSEPPAYLLPKFYNPSGGQPLKNTQVKFTMRYAVGKVSEITGVEDLDVVNLDGWNYEDYRYSTFGSTATIPLGPGGVTMGVTTTDAEGNFTVHIPCSEYFGLIQSGQVTLHYGGNQFVMSKTGYGLYRFITMEILDDRYCHPDAYLFPKHNQQLNLPKQISVVKSYNLNVLTRSSTHGQQAVGSGDGIPNVVVKIGRVKSAYEALPATYPKGESAIYQYGYPFGTGNPIRLLCDSGLTDANGKYVFRRLVRPYGYCSNSGTTGSGPVYTQNELSGNVDALTITDGYYLEAESHPFIGNTNYNKTFRYNIAPCAVGINSLDNHGAVQHRSHDYMPPTYNYTLTLTPKSPDIYASVRADYGTGPFPVPHSNLIFKVYKPGQPIQHFAFQTDQNGFFKKQIMYSDYLNGFASLDNNGFFSASYKMLYGKNGYSPSQCNHCTTAPLNTPVLLTMGRRWRPEAMLEPKGKVRGIVRDEAGQPIEGEVKIGAGVFMPLEALFVYATGTVHDNGIVVPDINPDAFYSNPYTSSQIGNYFNNAQQPATNDNSTYSNNGYNYTYNGPTNIQFTSESGFNIPAQSGSNIMVVIRPYATNLFQDTFYVDIPEHTSGAATNIGIFILRKKLHRPVITVRPSNSTTAVISGAQVILSDLPPKNTSSQGKATFTFPSPANEFRLQVIKDGYALYDEHVVIPVSKTPYPLTVNLQAGHTLIGMVKDVQTGAPLAGARVYCTIGTNTYGAITVETYTNSTGNYTLPNVPAGYRYFYASHVTTEVTYVGKKMLTSIPKSTPLNFLLQKAPFHLPHIWNLPVELTSFTATETGWKINGAFVNIPENARFKTEKENQRLTFSNIPIQAVNPQSSGQPLAVPTGNSITINQSQFRAILNNQHIMHMSGTLNAGSAASAVSMPLYNLHVAKSPTGNGELKAKAFVLLEAFRMEYQYNSNFFVGETADSPIIAAFKGSSDNSMPLKYKLMDIDMNLSPSNPQYTVQNFNAFADRNLSYLHADSIVLRTKLKVNLPLSNPSELEIDAGDIVVMKESINIFPGNKPLKFKLETWDVESVGEWTFDPAFGGIRTSGVIKTDLIDLNAPNMIIRPTELILPGAESMQQGGLSLSGITPLILKPGVNLSFQYYHSPQHDPQNGHWRVVLFSPDGPVAHISGLPGWNEGVQLNLQYLENFSDGFLAISVMPDQQINHYNVVKQNVTHLFKSNNGFMVSGSIDLSIPNLPDGYIGDFIYTKNGNNTQVRLSGLVTNFETYGQVHFLGDQQSDRIQLNWNLLKVPGKITIYDDSAPNTIQLRAMLIKQPNDIRLEIFKTDGQGILEGDQHQFISLGGGNSGRQKVLEGSQLVQGNSWQAMRYYAQMVGFNNAIKEGQDKMWFEVSGGIMNDTNAPDQIQLADIDTPFGAFSLAYIFSDMSIFGSLEVENIPLGGVYIYQGSGNMMVGGKGFFVAASLEAMYPGIGDLNTNFIAGSYPNIPPQTAQLLKQGMYLQKLPGFLIQSGIQGLYISANKPIVHEKFLIPLVLFELGIYVNTGLDARFWLNIGNDYGAANIGGLVYADVELYSRILVCDICVGLLGEIGLNIGYQWNPQSEFNGEICGSVLVNMSICGVSANESIKIEGTYSSVKGIDLEIVDGETCGEPVQLNSNGCKHF
jgi:hypothetical protein